MLDQGKALPVTMYSTLYVSYLHISADRNYDQINKAGVQTRGLTST